MKVMKFFQSVTMPLALVFAALFLIATSLWGWVFFSEKETLTNTRCNLPNSQHLHGSPSVLQEGSRVSTSTLEFINPLPLSKVKVQVLNSSGISGQASQISTQLREYGFGNYQTVTTANDPVYQEQSLQCYGQLRFGSNGRAAASTVWLVAPCVELIQDRRADAEVDLAVGTKLKSIALNANAAEVLRMLSDLDQEEANLDPDLLASAHRGVCS